MATTSFAFCYLDFHFHEYTGRTRDPAAQPAAASPLQCLALACTCFRKEASDGCLIFNIVLPARHCSPHQVMKMTALERNKKPSGVWSGDLNYLPSFLTRGAAQILFSFCGQQSTSCSSNSLGSVQTSTLC